MVITVICLDLLKWCGVTIIIVVLVIATTNTNNTMMMMMMMNRHLDTYRRMACITFEVD